MKKIIDLGSFPLLLFLAMIGSVLSFEFDFLPAFRMVMLFITAVVAGYAFWVARPALVIAAVLACGLIFWQQSRIAEDKVDYEQVLEQIELSSAVIGRVDSFPVMKGGKLSFNFHVIGVRRDGISDYAAVEGFTVLVRLSGVGADAVSRGDWLKIDSPVEVPRERVYDFAYRRYLFHNKLYGVLYIKEEKLSVINDKMQTGPLRAFCKRSLWRMRMDILKRLKGALNERVYPFIAAIFFGIRDELDSATYAGFQESGMVHLLAISGLHIGFLGLLVFRGANFFLSSSKSYLISLLFLFLYIMLITPSASSYRAFFMFMAGALFFVGGFRSGGVARLSISGLVLLFVNPYSLFNLGFQFSFLATAGILLYGKRIEERLPGFVPAFLRTNLAVTLSAFSSIALIQWSSFGRFPIFSLISSLFVVPLFALLFTALFFLLTLFVITGWPLLCWAVDFLSLCFLKIIALLAGIPPLELPRIPLYSGYIVFLLLIIGDSFGLPYLRNVIQKWRLKRLGIERPFLSKISQKRG